MMATLTPTPIPALAPELSPASAFFSASVFGGGSFSESVGLGTMDESARRKRIWIAVAETAINVAMEVAPLRSVYPAVRQVFRELLQMSYLTSVGQSKFL